MQCTAPDSANLLIELEARQDDVIQQLDELNRLIEQAIVTGQLGVSRGERSEINPAGRRAPIC